MLDWLARCSGNEVGSEVLWQDAVPGAEQLAAILIEGYAEYLDAVQSGAPPEVVLAVFERRRVLWVVREGEQGTTRLNELLTERFRGGLGRPPSGASWYAGRPVLAMANDYTVRVFNGDVGVALPGPGGRFLVHFPHLGGGTSASCFYTALTRARASVRLWARAAVLRDTITRRSLKVPLGLWEESGR